MWEIDHKTYRNMCPFSFQKSQKIEFVNCHINPKQWLDKARHQSVYWLKLIACMLGDNQRCSCGLF